MITALRGILEFKGADQVFVGVGGVSFQVFAPSSTLEKLGPVGARVQLHTYLHLRPDQVTLFGFSSGQERRYAPAKKWNTIYGRDTKRIFGRSKCGIGAADRLRPHSFITSAGRSKRLSVRQS